MVDRQCPRNWRKKKKTTPEAHLLAKSRPAFGALRLRHVLDAHTRCGKAASALQQGRGRPCHIRKQTESAKMTASAVAPSLARECVSQTHCSHSRKLFAKKRLSFHAASGRIIILEIDSCMVANLHLQSPPEPAVGAKRRRQGEEGLCKNLVRFRGLCRMCL